jgi:hypothetical protein
VEECAGHGGSEGRGGGALGVAARGRPDAGALPAGRVSPWIRRCNGGRLRR